MINLHVKNLHMLIVALGAMVKSLVKQVEFFYLSETRKLRETFY